MLTSQDAVFFSGVTLAYIYLMLTSRKDARTPEKLLIKFCHILPSLKSNLWRLLAITWLIFSAEVGQLLILFVSPSEMVVTPSPSGEENDGDMAEGHEPI